MELYEYQKELIDSKEKIVVANWCRGAGLTTALAYYILKKKPSFVGIYGNESNFKELIETIKSMVTNYTLVIHNHSQLLILQDGTSIELFKIISKLSPTIDKKYNLVIDLVNDTFINPVNCNKYIKAITKNFLDMKFNVQKEQSRWIIVDYTRALKANKNFINIEFLIETALNRPETFYREFALFGKPSEEETVNNNSRDNSETNAKSIKIDGIDILQMKNTQQETLDFIHKEIKNLQNDFSQLPTNDNSKTKRDILTMIEQLIHLEIKLRNNE